MSVDGRLGGATRDARCAAGAWEGRPERAHGPAVHPGSPGLCVSGSESPVPPRLRANPGGAHRSGRERCVCIILYLVCECVWWLAGRCTPAAAVFSIQSGRLRPAGGDARLGGLGPPGRRAHGSCRPADRHPPHGHRTPHSQTAHRTRAGRRTLLYGARGGRPASESRVSGEREGLSDWVGESSQRRRIHGLSGASCLCLNEGLPGELGLAASVG